MSLIVDRKVSAVYEARRLHRKEFLYPGDAHISGDVVVQGKLAVGGNLTADGKLDVYELYCLGEVNAKCDVNCGDIFVGVAIEATGDSACVGLCTDVDIDAMASWCGLEDDFRRGVDAEDKLAHPLVAEP